MNRFPAAGALHAPGRPLVTPLLAAALFATGCASLGDDAGLGAVRNATRPHLTAEPVWARSDADRDTLQRRVDALLAQPLTADDAVQVALFNNRGLQADYAALGLAEADLVQAGRLLNPGVTLGRTRQGGVTEREIGVQLGIAHLIAMPLARPIAKLDLERTQLATALQVLSLAHATRRAQVEAVAAEESLRHHERAQALAEAGAELAMRMAAAGNWSLAERDRHRAVLADTTPRLAQARTARDDARERLARLLGVDTPAALQLPDRLPELPPQPLASTQAEQQAMDARIDLQRLRLEARAEAERVARTNALRFVNVLELGASRTRRDGEPTERGLEVRFELPVFDTGALRNARAELQQGRTLDRAAAAAIDARSEVRGAWRDYRSRYEVAQRYRDDWLPQRQRLADDALLRYNGMFIGVFDLLADARLQVDVADRATVALRDFWLAQADLGMALAGPLSAGGAR